MVSDMLLVEDTLWVCYHEDNKLYSIKYKLK